jgi:4-hydroxybenzoyl-CoA thioesterase
MVHFTRSQKVQFKHCDPAGIVFYPRYFEMINDTVEAFFDEVLHWPFEEIHPEAAVPTAAFNVAFKAPCRHGEMLEFTLTVLAIGRSSLSLRITALADGSERLVADQTLVRVDGAGRSAPWPDSVSQKVSALLTDR